MFQTATKMVATLTVRNANSKMGGFNLTAKESGAQITLNYTKDTESIVDKVIADKDSNCNIVKGILVD